MANHATYKVHKQMYPATYNFRDETDGTSGTDIEFIDTILSDGDHFIIASDWQGHRKVLKWFDDDAYAGIQHDITQATSGTFEFWLGSNDVTNASTRVYLQEGGTLCTHIRFVADQLQDNGAANLGAIVDDTPHHIKLEWTAGNVLDVWLDGVLVLNDDAFTANQVSGIDNITIRSYSNNAAVFYYLDAWGESWDTDYAIGDNVHWRHYKESTDLFEGDDVGDTGTDITWVDSVDTAASTELIAEFNEHKKIIRQDYTSAVGGYDYCYHNMASQATAGWWAGWIKTNDVTNVSCVFLNEGGTYIIRVKFDASKIQYWDNAAWQDALDPVVNDTWYLLYLQWYADDTFDIWIDNVLIASGVTCDNAQVSGVNRCQSLSFNSGTYLYLDAPTSSLDSDSRGDNRTFNYNTTYTKETITSDIIQPAGTKGIMFHEIEGQKWYQVVLLTHDDLVLNSLHLVQIYDANSDLAFEGTVLKTVDCGMFQKVILEDLNRSGLIAKSSSSYSAQNPSDILLGEISNVSQTDGRLIYYEEHDPTASRSPNYNNKPLYLIARESAHDGDTGFILKANGVCYLDDDETVLGTITEASGEILQEPLIEVSTHQINKVTVRGRMDADTGTRFSGVSEDTTAQDDGGGIIEYTRINNALRSDTDCENHAIAIRTGTGFQPSMVRVTLEGVRGRKFQRISFAYSHKSFSATNMYIMDVQPDLISDRYHYILTTGLFEGLDFNISQHLPFEEVHDDITETLYETDINTVYPDIMPGLGSAFGLGAGGDYGVVLNAATDHVVSYFYIDDKVDESRGIEIKVFWTRDDANNDTLTGSYSVNNRPVDGSAAWASVSGSAVSFDACASGRGEHYSISLSSATSNYEYRIFLTLGEASRSITVTSIVIRYYIKRA